MTSTNPKPAALPLSEAEELEMRDRDIYGWPDSDMQRLFATLDATLDATRAQLAAANESSLAHRLAWDGADLQRKELQAQLAAATERVAELERRNEELVPHAVTDAGTYWDDEAMTARRERDAAQRALRRLLGASFGLFTQTGAASDELHAARTEASAALSSGRPEGGET